MPGLTLRRVLLFYLPLAANSLLMTVESPVVTAAISRLPEAKLSLAAFGVMMAVSPIVGLPIGSLLHTANAMGQSRQSFHVLKRFSLGVILSVSTITFLLYFTPLFDPVVEGIMGAPHDVAQVARSGLQVCVLSSAAVGWRRFYQGILIRQGYTAPVGYCTIARLATLVTVAVVGVSLGNIPGMVVGAAALVSSVIVESLLVMFVAEGVIRRDRHPNWLPDDQHTISYGQLWPFYAPLLVTALTVSLARPSMNFAMSFSPDPVLALAAVAVAMTTLDVLRSPLIALQQVVIALVRDDASFRMVRRFVMGTSACFALFLFTASFTPAIELYLRGLLRVPADVFVAALPAVRMFSAYLLLMMWQSLYQGVLIASRKTVWIQAATVGNLATMCLLLAVGTIWGGGAGASLAALAYVAGLATEAVVLWRRQRVLTARGQYAAQAAGTD